MGVSFVLVFLCRSNKQMQFLRITAQVHGNHPPGFETRWSQVIRPRHPLGCTTDVFLRCLEGLHPVFETWRTAGPLGQALALSEGTSRVAGFEKRASR